jgi:hypothetical protein
LLPPVDIAARFEPLDAGPALPRRAHAGYIGEGGENRRKSIELTVACRTCRLPAILSAKGDRTPDTLGGLMRIASIFAGIVLLAANLAAQQVAPPKTHLKAGDQAPDFSLKTTAGTTFKLSEQRGKTVVLAFFPAAFTGG